MEKTSKVGVAMRRTCKNDQFFLRGTVLVMLPFEETGDRHRHMIISK